MVCYSRQEIGDVSDAHFSLSRSHYLCVILMQSYTIQHLDPPIRHIQYGYMTIRLNPSSKVGLLRYAYRVQTRYDTARAQSLCQNDHKNKGQPKHLNQLSIDVMVSLRYMHPHVSTIRYRPYRNAIVLMGRIVSETYQSNSHAMQLCCNEIFSWVTIRIRVSTRIRQKIMIVLLKNVRCQTMALLWFESKISSLFTSMRDGRAPSDRIVLHIHVSYSTFWVVCIWTWRASEAQQQAKYEWHHEIPIYRHMMILCTYTLYIYWRWPWMNMNTRERRSACNGKVPFCQPWRGDTLIEVANNVCDLVRGTSILIAHSILVETGIISSP